MMLNLTMKGANLHYLLYGILFGLCFPITALSIDIIIHNLPFTWQSTQYLHGKNFLHKIIDLAPIVLGFMGYRLGQNKNQLDQHVSNLERQISERTQKLHQAAAEVKAANKAKSIFLSQMNHEFYTPLNAVLGFSQLLKLENENFTEDEKMYVSEIIIAGQHLISLINKMLDLAKIESEQMEVKIEEVKVNLIVNDVLESLEEHKIIQNISIINNINNKNRTVLADKNRLKQVIIHLLSNAIKYNKKDGLITLWSEKVIPNRIRIYIEDTGIGLTEEDINRLFIPFKRLVAKEKSEGSGIGLSISKNLIELMNGTIGVKSAVDQGTTFWIELKSA